MKIIVKDAQEAIEVADVLKQVAGSICCDQELQDDDVDYYSGFLCGMRETIEVENEK